MLCVPHCGSCQDQRYVYFSLQLFQAPARVIMMHMQFPKGKQPPRGKEEDKEMEKDTAIKVFPDPDKMTNGHGFLDTSLKINSERTRDERKAQI